MANMYNNSVYEKLNNRYNELFSRATELDERLSDTEYQEWQDLGDLLTPVWDKYFPESSDPIIIECPNL